MSGPDVLCDEEGGPAVHTLDTRHHAGRVRGAGVLKMNIKPPHCVDGLVDFSFLGFPRVDDSVLVDDDAIPDEAVLIPVEADDVAAPDQSSQQTVLLHDSVQY